APRRSRCRACVLMRWLQSAAPAFAGAAYVRRIAGGNGVPAGEADDGPPRPSGSLRAGLRLLRQEVEDVQVADGAEVAGVRPVRLAVGVVRCGQAGEQLTTGELQAGAHLDAD